MPTDDGLLTQLCERWEAARACGESVTPEDLCREHPELLGELRRAVHHLAAADRAVAAPAPGGDPYPDLPSLPDGCRYRLVQFLAQGGLGRVYAGEDLELGREVAVKFVRPDRASAAALARFRREAEVTGRLEHPGVAPVYGLVELPDGGFCYAMRLLRGETLSAAIDRLPAADHPDRPAALRKLLRHFIAVCDAVAFAHSRGVLHRDLKPANVMLGEFGETWVLDWGLAKTAAGADAAGAAGPPAESGAASGTPLPDQTVPGSAVGTPGFMSPEQAGGDPAAVGPTADVYGLGATLAAILTGRGPRPAESAADWLAGARPPALAAVSAKALSSDPAARYATAAALAADVERWLADEPVSAYRDPLPERARRWAKRNRTLVAAAAVAVLIGLISTSIGLAVIGGKNRELDRLNASLTTANSNLADTNEHLELSRRAVEVERNEVTRQKAESDESAREARAAVERYFTTVSQSRLLLEPGMLPLRRELLKAALDFYQKLAVEQRQRPGDREELARTLERVGDIQRDAGAWDDAIRTYTEARAIVAARPASDPKRNEALVHLDYYLAAVFNAAGRSTESAEALTRAQAGIPDGWKSTERQAKLDIPDGLMAYNLGQHDRAQQLLRRGTDGLSRLVRDNPQNASYRAYLCYGLTALGRSFAQSGDPVAAEEAFESALTHARLLTLRHPGKAEYPYMEKICLTAFGELLRKQGRHGEAVKHATNAAEHFETLATREPTNALARQSAGEALYQLGRAQHESGQPEIGGRTLRRAFIQFAEALRREPQNQMIANRAYELCTEMVREERYAEARLALGTLIDELTPRLKGDQRLGPLVVRALIARATACYFSGDSSSGLADTSTAVAVLGSEPQHLVAVRALGLALTGKHEQATSALDNVAKLKADHPAELRYRAWGYAAAALAVLDDSELGLFERTALGCKYSLRAKELLKQSLQNRPLNDSAAVLRKLPAFRFLATDAEVRQMLETIAVPAAASVSRPVAPAPRPVQ